MHNYLISWAVYKLLPWECGCSTHQGAGTARPAACPLSRTIHKQSSQLASCPLGELLSVICTKEMFNALMATAAIWRHCIVTHLYNKFSLATYYIMHFNTRCTSTEMDTPIGVPHLRLPNTSQTSASFLCKSVKFIFIS